MLERLTPNARQAVVVAGEEARGLGAEAIGPEHLLLGLLRAGGAAQPALAQLGLREAAARAAAAGRQATDGWLPLTPELSALLAEGGDTASLLRGLARDPRGSSILRDCGVALEDLEAALAGATDDDGGPPDPRDPGPPIAVQLEGLMLGDLGNPRVDARLLLAIALRGGPVADWLRARGIDEPALRLAFGDFDLGFEAP